ncbi:hypothetical protein LTS17_005287 [Exophiala oligosperma]
MVDLNEVIESNKHIAASFPTGLVAVFVGGTSGVGEYTVKKFASRVTNSRVYIVGRSQEAAERILDECGKLGPSSKYEFIKADVSLMKVVDQVCTQIKSKESAVNILFQTQGSMAFTSTTAEGLPVATCLPLHSRQRFIVNLLPLLHNAKSLRRIVSVGAATYEGPIDLDNISGQGFALRKWRNQLSSCQSLLLQRLARQTPDVSFVHNVPGVVRGGIMREVPADTGLGLRAIMAISGLLMPLIETPVDECGERHLFLATSARYPPAEGNEGADGVMLGQDTPTARGLDGHAGSGVYSLTSKGDSAAPKVENILRQFEENGTAAKVWEYVAADFRRTTGTEIGS